MSQRASGYQRIERDNYETPEWVTLALIPHIPERIKTIYEPAAGSGKMVRALAQSGRMISADDINDGRDFLECYWPSEAIITNPPYELAREFAASAILLTNKMQGFVAMLLRTDFDHAASRRDLFADNNVFAKKIVLTRRIQWFEHSTASPSFNHAWFVWDWQHKGPPTLAYGP